MEQKIKPNITKSKLFKLVKLLKEKKPYIKNNVEQYHNVCVISSYLSKVIEDVDLVIDREVDILRRLKNEHDIDS